MKAQIVLERDDIGTLLALWARERGYSLRGWAMSVEIGDPADPREAHHRREKIIAEVELADIRRDRPGSAT